MASPPPPPRNPLSGLRTQDVNCCFSQHAEERQCFLVTHLPPYTHTPTSIYCSHLGKRTVIHQHDREATFPTAQNSSNKGQSWKKCINEPEIQNRADKIQSTDLYCPPSLQVPYLFLIPFYIRIFCFKSLKKKTHQQPSSQFHLQN